MATHIFGTPFVCKNRYNDVLYVNKVGMYKFGETGLVRTGGFRTVITVDDDSDPDNYRPVTMRLSRIMASTFTPLPRDLKRYPLSVYVDRLDPAYVPGLVHANTLAWIRPGKNVARMFDTTEVRIPGEIWRFSERYKLHVSNQGRFKTDMGTINSFKTMNLTYGMGYHRFNVRGESVHFHAVVADAFFGPPPPDRPMIDHIDGNSYNNSPLNLRYVDCRENNNNRRFDRRPTPVSVDSDDYEWVPAMSYPYAPLGVLDVNSQEME